MPYKSKAQERYFHYLESKGKMPKKTVDEFDEASKGMDMPEHLWEGGYAKGGMIDEEDEYRMEDHDLDNEYKNSDEDDQDDDVRHMFKGGIAAPMHGEESYKMKAFGHNMEDEAELEDKEDYIPAGGKHRSYAKGGRVSPLAKALMRRGR